MAALRVLLVAPGKSKDDGGGRTWIPSGLLEVATIMRKAGATVFYHDETTRGHIKEVPKVDLCCVGGLTTSRLRAKDLAKLFHRLGYKVLAGGMDVTGLYKEGDFEELRHFDIKVVGHLTESLCVEVFNDFRSECCREYYFTNEPIEWHIPAHDLVDPKKYLAPAYRSSQGCSHNCSFCTIKLVCGETTVCKDAEILEEELLSLPRSLIQVDAADNFGAPYDFIMNVVFPLRNRIRHPWAAEISAIHLLGDEKAGRNELFSSLRKANACAVYFGVENPFVKISDKSLPTEAYEEVVRKLHENRIVAIGSFILDLFDSESKADTEESIRKSFDWMTKTNFDIVQLSMLALLPGSELRKRARRENAIIDYNPEHYCGGFPTRAHPLSPETRINLYAEGYKRFYSPHHILGRVFGTRPVPNLIANLHAKHVSKNWSKQNDFDYWTSTRWLAPNLHTAE